MEKEAARVEKISRSNERLGGRSGSLERRKSGEDTVQNQFTIHGEFFCCILFVYILPNNLII
jgi:hypothetical protein